MIESHEPNEKLIDCFQRHEAILVVVARRYVPTPDSVFDVIQDTYVDLVEVAKLGNIDLEQDLLPLLCRMVKNKAISAWRKEQRFTPEALRKIGEHFMERSRCQEEAQSDRLAVLRKCVEKLPEKNRKLLKSHYFDGVPIETLAEAEGMKSGAVRQLFFRLRNLLRTCIEQALKTQK